MASALDAAHQRGVLHRDVKPENLLLGDHHSIKLSDFGVAKIVGAANQTRTTAGMIIGTPAYLAPEQVTGQALGPATDVYATSIMLYRLLAGDFPFPPVEESVARLFQHVHEPPIPLGLRCEVPAPVASVIMRGLEKDPADRYLTAEAFGLALAQNATVVWGPGWLRRSGIELRSAPNLLAATEMSRTPTPGGDPHDTAELLLLERLQRGDTLGARPAEVEAMCALLGAHGTLAAERLQLPAGATVDELRTAALEQLGRWRRRTEHPLTSPELRDACLILSRACESVVARLG
jgi:serine/threonine protein kinase